MLKGISFLSLDFGRLSAENLDLRNELKQAQLEIRQLHERCGRKIYCTNVPISVDSSIQTDTETCSGSTTPSIPADPLNVCDDLNLLAMQKELQILTEENVSRLNLIIRYLQGSLKQFAKEYQIEMADAFEHLRSQLITAISGHFSKLLRRYQEEVELRRALHNVLIELRG